ncbi:hypothetical protein, partial [Enterobacter cloacae]|uniref:hypothetical protein n=1 Tax=Enterobacter cloacae TaxID=550 RepID=UPI0019541B35
LHCRHHEMIARILRKSMAFLRSTLKFHRKYKGNCLPEALAGVRSTTDQFTRLMQKSMTSRRASFCGD